MTYKFLGKSNLQISRISFGCMSMPSSDMTSEALVNRAIEIGINFFDTADIYERGENEKRIGHIIKQKRTDLILASKVGNRLRADGSGLDWVPSKKYILNAVESSLKRLGTDYIDLYQLHGGTLEDPIEEIIEAFELLQQQGKIRYYGISSIRPNVIREYVAHSAIVSVMMQYSLLDRRPEETCMDLLKENNIGMLARGCLAQGLLINKPAKEYLSHSLEEVRTAAAAVESITTSEKSKVQTALGFVLHQKSICSAVVGIKTLEQLENIKEADTDLGLTESELDFLRQAIPARQYDRHR